MAEFKVSAERVELFLHPNAERLEIARAGEFGFVVGKWQYKNGDIVVFAPKRSILPEEIRGEYCNKDTGESYLKRGAVVKSVRLRGELSEGVTLDKEWVLGKVFSILKDHLNLDDEDFWEWSNEYFDRNIGYDLSECLGIVEDIPEIPKQFTGVQSNIKASNVSLHDCAAFRFHKNDFKECEMVIVSEKLHGTQINIIMHEDDETVEIGSKGLLKRGIVLDVDSANIYWKAFLDSGIMDIKKALWPGQFVQVMGEVVPAQKGFSYGYETPVIRVFRVEVLKVRQSVFQIFSAYDHTELDGYKDLLAMWVPFEVIPYCESSIVAASKGMEGVSGKKLHIKEGVVVEPIYPRQSRSGKELIVKVINPKYKGDDDDMS